MEMVEIKGKNAYSTSMGALFDGGGGGKGWKLKNAKIERMQFQTTEKVEI